jgi:hypothetical protein
VGSDGGYFGGVEYLGLRNGLRKVIGVVVVFLIDRDKLGQLLLSMIDIFRFKGLGQVAAAVVAVLTLSQCALPPGTAWTVIRKDGVKDYFAISWGKKPVPDYVKELVPEAFGLPTPEVDEGGEESKEEEGGVIAEGEAFSEVPGTLPEDWARPVEPVFPLMATEPPALVDGGTAPVGAQGFGVNPLLGEVAKDEFAQVDLPDAVTAPVVAIDEKLKGGAPGLKMKDPVAAGPSEEVVNHLAEGLKEGVKTEGVPVAGKSDAVATEEMPKSEVAKVEGQETPKTEVAKVGGQEMPKSEVAKVEGQETSKTEVAKVESRDSKVEKFLPEMVPGSVTKEVPFGLLVEGRPGYVRSPYAQSHQIVDVTGLKVGTSVKCPFSGKFFRVPAAHAAMNEAVKAQGPVEGKMEAPKDEEVEL